ncbi:MAG: hypothetical protein HKL84_10045 [Acidimicrobiaceae bacterium]|nr:hypothetical protein [Acidimicrobiaceae bacterium]
MNRNRLLSTKTVTLAAGIFFALVTSSCSSVNSSATSTTNSSPGSGNVNLNGDATTTSQAKPKNLGKVTLNQSHLTGVDVQIAFSTIQSSKWTEQNITLAAESAASLGSSNGEKTVSLPITGGDFQYYKASSSTGGSIDTLGGIILSGNGQTLTKITNMSINLNQHEITASINGSKNTNLFIINGAPAISQQGSHIVVYGITIQLAQNASSELQGTFMSDRSLGAVTITTSMS